MPGMDARVSWSKIMRVINLIDPISLIRKEISDLVNLPTPDRLIESPFAVRWHLGHTIIGISQQQQNIFHFMRFDRHAMDVSEEEIIALPKDLKRLRFRLEQVRIESKRDFPKEEPKSMKEVNNVPKCYEGFVLSVGQETFWARLIDQTRLASNEEFDLDEVSLNQRHLVKKGAAFYWYIGYHDSPGGQRRRQSLIMFP